MSPEASTTKLQVGSRLEKVLESGRFAVTTEIGPPRSSNPEPVREHARILKPYADACNITDNQTAVVRMSSVAAAKLLIEEGLEPIMQMTARDRNRIAIQSDLLGAAALGIRNCLCISGDHQQAGGAGKLNGHPGCKNVYDLDSIQMLAAMKGLRDESVQVGGDEVSEPLPMLIGAAWTPLAPPQQWRTYRLGQKITAGADFIQTQAVYDIAAFTEAVSAARDLGLTEKTAILAGVILPKSAGMLKYMNANVPGVVVPDDLIKRMAGAEDRRAESIKVTVELIHAVREIPGVRGVHLQAIASEEMLPEIIEAAGITPPSVD
jgi:5,10-methylenetetrahydrofolate reductase